MTIAALIPTMGERPEMFEQALASVKAQTEPADEIVIVKGGKHLWDALNTEIAKITSDAFFVLGDDDMIKPTFIQHTKAIMERWNCDIVTTCMEEFGERSGVHCPHKIPFMTSLTSKRIWEKVGGYDDDCKVAGDADFWLSCTEADARWERSGEPLFMYRVHGGQWSRNADWEAAMKRVKEKHPNA